MAHYKSKLSKGLERNTILQGVLLALYIFILAVYLIAYMFNIAGIVYSLEANESKLTLDTGLQDVKEYTVGDDGTISGTLSSGREFKLSVKEVVFVRELPDSKVALYTGSSILCCLDSTFADSIVLQSKLYLILCLSAGISAMLFSIRRGKYGVLSKRYARVMCYIISIVSLVLFFITYSVF